MILLDMGSNGSVIAALITGVAGIIIALINQKKEAPKIDRSQTATQIASDTEKRDTFHVRKKSIYIISLCLILFAVAVVPVSRLLRSGNDDTKGKADSIARGNNPGMVTPPGNLPAKPDSPKVPAPASNEALNMSVITEAEAGVGANSFYFFETRDNGHVYYSSGTLGGAGSDMREVDGNIVATSSPAAGAVGSQVFVAVRGPDNNIYLNQATNGHSFNNSWQRMDFQTDVAPALVGVQNYIYIFAKNLSGQVYFRRAALGQAFEDWKIVEGDKMAAKGSSPAAGAINDYIYLVIRGTDNQLYLNQASAGHSFGQWSPMNFTSNASPAVTGVGNYVYFFAIDADGKVKYDYSALGGGGQGWREVNGNNVPASAVFAGSVSNDYIFVSIRGNDGRLYLNQTDVLKPFNNWSPTQ